MFSAKAVHPYFPIDAEIIGYAANEQSVPALLGAFFGACTFLFAATFFIANAVNPKLKKGELLTIMWFVLSGSIHMFFEGYYAVNHADLGSKQTMIGQMWKEYAFSDSRYLTNDAFVLCMETITATCWGPLCMVVATCIVMRHPLRFPLQSIVSMGQIYGDVLYYATCYFDHYKSGISYSRPEAFYFWFYFVFMNFIWIVIPGYLVYESIRESSKAFEIVQSIDSKKKGR